MPAMQKQQGFTLVELIIVIVILGILAVTAAPRFLNISGDARASTLNAVKGSLESASALVYGKSIIAGIQNQAVGEVTDPAGDIDTVYGYPAATVDVINIILDLDSDDWTVGADDDDVIIKPAGFTPAENTQCRVTYTAASAAGQKPTITVTSTGC